ncbi:MAG: hypothetical protein V4550_16370 [Gemmatimonadota bacterium]
MNADRLIAFRRAAALVASLLGFLATPTRAQRQVSADSATSAPITGVAHEITADRASLEARHLGVSTQFDVAGNGVVLLSLPTWTPGAYEISNYARSVSDFRVTEGGVTLRWDKLDHNTWRIRPTGAGRVTVTYHVGADSLDNAMSWARTDFVLFNGTNLFMYAEGRSLDVPATVLVKTEPDYRIATSMTSAGAARRYKATNYHDLVDMPFFVGKFDLDSATISGKTFRYATYPVGSVAGAARTEAWSQLKRIVPAEMNVFGEVPWESYTLMQIADSSYGGYSGLEHSASHVDIVNPAFVGSDDQPSLYAHEIFHAWNVKRLRPADLTPYAYDREQPTTWLWVSEGITDYYADLTSVRAGVQDAQGFYALTVAKIGEIGLTVPFALEDASLNTWMHPADGTAYSYYPKGSLAGLMLDVMIRDASDNKKSLDTVMRDLYETTYKKGRGFSHADFWGAVQRAAGGKSFDDFEQKFVDGREPYPWPTVLRAAGMRLQPDSLPRLGVTTAADPAGAAGAINVVDVDAGSAAANAGVRVGDVMISVGEISVADADFGAKFRLRYAGRPSGSPFPIIVKRGAETVTLHGALLYVASLPRLTDDPTATARAVRIREGIMRGTTDR